MPPRHVPLGWKTDFSLQKSAVNRIVVVGSPGSGKSTLAERLGRQRECPFIDLDALRWDPDWTQVSTAEFRQRTAAAIDGGAWAAAGNASAVRDILWGQADTIVWLDYPLSLVMWRLWWRTLRRIVTQEELYNGNQESFREQFFSRESLLLYAVQTYRSKQREFIRDLARPQYAHLDLRHFRSAADTDIWLRDLEGDQGY